MGDERSPHLRKVNLKSFTFARQRSAISDSATESHHCCGVSYVNTSHELNLNVKSI